MTVVGQVSVSNCEKKAGVYAAYTPEHVPTGEFLATHDNFITNRGQIGCRLFKDKTGKEYEVVEMSSSLATDGNIVIVCRALNCIFNQTPLDI